MKVRRLLLTGMVVVAMAAPASFGCGTLPCVDLIHTYFSDGTFTTAVGGYEKDCDDVETQWGTTSDWRRIDSYGCATGGHTAFCGHWNGSSWDSVTCP